MNDALYALRVRGENRYLIKYRARSTPHYATEPTFWKTRKQAETVAVRHEIERACGSLTMPEIEIVTYEIKPIETKRQRIRVSAVDLAIERITRTYGHDVGNAFRCAVAAHDYDEAALREYKYAFRWRGAGKQIVADNIPSAITYGSIAIVKTDSDLVYGRMVLAAGLIQHYDLRIAFQ